MASNTKKRTLIEYLDFVIVILNVFIIIFSVFKFQNNVSLVILNLISIIILFGQYLYTSLRRNPYYVSSAYGINLFGMALAFGLLTVLEFYNSLIWLGFLIIGSGDLIYVIYMLKGSGSSASRVATAGGRVWTLVEPGTDTPSYVQGGRVDRKQKRAIQKKYHMSWIVLITSITLFIIFLTYIL